jgi:hypothetical protein
MALKFILVAKEILKYPRVRNILHPVELFLLAADPFTPMQSYSPQSGFLWGTNFVVFLDQKNWKSFGNFFLKRILNKKINLAKILDKNSKFIDIFI